MSVALRMSVIALIIMMSSTAMAKENFRFPAVATETAVLTIHAVADLSAWPKASRCAHRFTLATASFASTFSPW